MFSLGKTEINRKEEYAMKKILALLMAAMMLLGMCSFASAEDEKIHIIFQYSFEEQMRAPILAVIDQFMKDNPDIVVECVYGGSYSESNTKLLAAHAAAMQGDKSGYPAVQQTEVSSVSTFAENGVIACMDDLIVANNFPIDKYFAGMLSAYSYNGSQYAIPAFASVCPTMYYNKTLCDALGAEVPKTWDEMEAWLEKVTIKDENGNTTRYGLCLAGWGAAYFSPIWWQNGCTAFLDEECTQVGFGTEEALATTRMLKDWVDKGYVKWCYGTNASTNMRQSFIDGNSMAVFHTCAVYSVYKPGLAANGWEVGVAFPPAGVKSTAQLGGSGLTIMSQLTDKEKEAAFKLVAAMTGSEVNMIITEATGYLPTSQITLDSDRCKEWVVTNPQLQNLYDHLAEVEGPAGHPLWGEVSKKWMDALALIFNEGADLESTIADMVEECNEILEEF